MELYFITRGKTDVIDEWVKWMGTRHLPMTIKMADGSEQKGLVECQLRPVQLWSFVFPKENLDIVLNTLKLDGGDQNPFVNEFNINPKLWALRKLLKADPIPKKLDRKDKDSVMFMPFERIKNMNVLGIGLRDDGEISTGTHDRI